MQYINAGPGAKYRFLGDFASDQDGFRFAFIEAFRNHVPGAVETLREVVPVYRQWLELWEEFHRDETRRAVYMRFLHHGSQVPLGLNRNVVRTDGRQSRPSFSWNTVSHADAHLYPDLLALRATLIQWGERWHMAENGWFMNTAIGTVEDWVAYPTLYEAGVFIPRGCAEFSAAMDEESRFCFEDTGWTPNMQHWPDFEQVLMKRFKSELNRYHSRLVEIAKSRGFHEVPKQHRPEHFVWLALYHCAGWKLEDIRTHYGESVTNRQAIHTAIKAAAVLVGIDLKSRVVKKH